uniref:Secretin n=1 Tax=Terrapene triunguis TaxID=2587831 RepID=A0A674IH53_9SAUR
MENYSTERLSDSPNITQEALRVFVPPFYNFSPPLEKHSQLRPRPQTVCEEGYSLLVFKSPASTHSFMNENAYVQKLVKSLVGLNQRYQRHSDGMFTSELSKMRGNAQVQKLIKSLVGYKRSHPLVTGSSYDDFCFMWLYQSFLNDRYVGYVSTLSARIITVLLWPSLS